MRNFRRGRHGDHDFSSGRGRGRANVKKYTSDTCWNLRGKPLWANQMNAQDDKQNQNSSGDPPSGEIITLTKEDYASYKLS